MNSQPGPFELTICPACGHFPGPRAKFCSECGLALHALAPLSAVPARRVRGLPPLNRAERRQLTVMFCDLVGSTELSTRMDPEDLSELLGRYRALVESEVERLGGTTDRFLGDGVMVYFGYPLAREDDAVRAVRAALAIVRGMETLRSPQGPRSSQALQVHIGIHTGMVLIDRTPGGAGDIIGETPNLASKVESLAPPDTVLVSSATHALTAELFDFAPWGPLELKGFSPSLHLHRLIGERDWRREVGFGRPAGKQLFGRATETALLDRLWREAKGDDPTHDGVAHAGQERTAGSGRVAVIVGEPGIGKTRLTQWIADRAEASGGQVLKFFCAEEATDTAFWPISETVARLLRLTGQSNATQFHRLSRAAARAGLPEDQFVGAMSDLLSLDPSAFEPSESPSVPLPKGDKSTSLSPEGRRQRLVDVLLAWVAMLAAESPLLVVVENVHWADPSSRVLLAELARRARTQRLLLLVTCRPAGEEPLADISAVERIALERLPSGDLEAMLTALWREAILPGDMQRLLLDKCDGVPLFLEQLVKTVAERASRGGSAVLPDVPTSLRDMLASRLDRLGSARLIALAASVIGRQFPARLLRALLPRRGHEIDAGLSALAAADIIIPAGAPGEAMFRFRHALLRDAAYDSLLRSERAKFHRTLARAYRKHYAPLVEAQPELVARHASAAGDIADALDYWWKAGLRARARSANREATAHFRAGIADAERIEDVTERKQQTVRFTMATSRAAFAAEGFASPEVERLNSRALALVEEGSSSDALPTVLGAMFSFYQVRGPLRRAQESGERLLTLLDATRDIAGLASNKRRVGWCLFCRGEIRTGKALLGEALALARQDVPSEEGGLAVSDTTVIGQANLGWVESFSSDLVSGADRCRDALNLARRRYADRGRNARDVGNLPSEVAYALCMSAAVAKQVQDPAEVIKFAGEACEFSGAHDLPYWRAWATVLLGWGVAHVDPDRGTALLHEGIGAYKATGARLFVPYNLALLAEACMAFDRASEGLTYVAEAKSVGEQIDAHFMDAELLRIEARLRAQTGDMDGALETLGHSMALAEMQGAITIRQWSARDRIFLKDGTRGPPGLIAAAWPSKESREGNGGRG
jgi:class 3 adenylate cyclase